MSNEVKDIIDGLSKKDWDKVFGYLQQFNFNEPKVSFTDGQLEAIKAQNLHEQHFQQLLGFVSKLAKAKDASEITQQKQQMIDYYESQISQLLDKTLLDQIKIKTVDELKADEDISEIASRYNELKDKIDIEYLMVKNDLGKSFIHHLFDKNAPAEDIAFYLNKLDKFSINIKETYLKISHDNESVEELIRSKVTEDAYKNLANLCPLAEKIIKQNLNVEVRAVVDTHTTSIHESVNESFRRMARKYAELYLPDEISKNIAVAKEEARKQNAEISEEDVLSVEIKEIKKHWQTNTNEDLAEFKKQLEEKITLLKSENSTEEDKQHVIFKYETTLTILEDLINDKQYGSQFPIQPSESVLHGLNMREIVAVSFGLLRDKENWQNQENADDHFSSLIDGIYDGINRCAGGIVNSLLTGMLDYKLASIIVINPDTIKNDLVHLLPEILSTISDNKDFQEKYKTDLIKWANTGYASDELGNIIIDKFFALKEKEEQNLYDSSKHRRIAIDGFKLIKTEEVSKVIKVLADETKENIEVKEFYNDVLQKVFVNIDVFIKTKLGDYALFLDSDDFRARYEKVQDAKMEPILDEEEFEKAVLEYFQLYFAKKNTNRFNQKVQLLLLYSESSDKIIANIAKQGLSLLIKNKINKKYYNDKTALHIAAEEDFLDIIKLLLKEISDEVINAKDDFGDTALHIAVLNSDAKIVKLLLEKMSPDAINAVDNKGNSAFHSALIYNRLDIIPLLLEKMSQDEITKYGPKALQYSIELGHIDVVKLLLEKMSQDAINAADNQGLTALHIAASKGNLEIIKLLLEKTSEDAINAADDYYQTALHTAFIFNKLEIIPFLLEKMTPEAINIVDNKGNTALHIAVEGRNLEIIKLLMKKMTPEAINAVDNKGRIALHYAVYHGHLEIIPLLLEKISPGLIDIADIRGKSALAYAVSKRNLEMIEILINAGAKVSVEGKSALDYAEKGSELETMLIMLDAEQNNKANIDNGFVVSLMKGNGANHGKGI
jgi:ankyrin repeat protein